MKVNVLRSGGFAGLTTAWEVRVDEQPDPAQWLRLVNSCPWNDPDQRSPGQDRYVYELKAGPHRTTLGEEYLQGPWRVLVDKVRADGRRLPAAH